MERRQAAPHILTVSLCLIMTGCASLLPGNCERFQDDRKKTDYSTRYRYSESRSQEAEKKTRPLPRGAAALVRHYQIRMSDRKTHVCRHISIEKDLHLQRIPRAAIVLEEVREIYTERGGRIATRTENVTRQLGRTGYYLAEVPFPIPEKTPPGSYRLVSRLIMKSRAYGTRQLSATETRFTVLTRR